MFPKKLIKGYGRFMGERFPDEEKTYKKAGKGQKPSVLLISCCDSRVMPEIIFDADPGEIFTLRNVANIVPPYDESGAHAGVVSAIEFALLGLPDECIKHIVVVGHASCGGIKAYAGKAKPLTKANFAGKWVALVKPAAEALAKEGVKPSAPDYQTRLEYASVAQSLKNLETYDFISARVAKGDLQLHGAHFGIEHAELRIRDPKTGAFNPALESGGKAAKPSALMRASDA